VKEIYFMFTFKMENERKNKESIVTITEMQDRMIPI